MFSLTGSLIHNDEENEGLNPCRWQDKAPGVPKQTVPSDSMRGEPLINHSVGFCPFVAYISGEEHVLPAATLWKTTVSLNSTDRTRSRTVLSEAAPPSCGTEAVNKQGLTVHRWIGIAKEVFPRQAA